MKSQKGIQVFSGLAHFIKGGIFFWYGLLTLGRVMGSFSDLGWSWNIKPPASIVGPRRASSPSAEFVESLLIFIYGSTNVFLEHLGSTDSQWTAADLEHVSISIIFFGGGLVSRDQCTTWDPYSNTALSAECSLNRSGSATF